MLIQNKKDKHNSKNCFRFKKLTRFRDIYEMNLKKSTLNIKFYDENPQNEDGPVLGEINYILLPLLDVAIDDDKRQIEFEAELVLNSPETVLYFPIDHGRFMIRGLSFRQSSRRRTILM